MSDEQQPEETAKAYSAFVEYCALGYARSLHKLALIHGETAGKARVLERQYEKWSSLYNWQERVKQYDAERAEEKRIKREQAQEEMRNRHADEAKEEQKIARDVIKKGAEKGRISLPAVQLLKNSREDERKALGVNDDQGVAVDVNASQENVQVHVYYPKRKTENEGSSDGSSSV